VAFSACRFGARHARRSRSHLKFPPPPKMIKMRRGTFSGGGCVKRPEITSEGSLVEISSDKKSFRVGGEFSPLSPGGEEEFKDFHNYGGIVGTLETTFLSQNYHGPLGNVSLIFRNDALEGRPLFDHLLFQGGEYRPEHAGDVKPWEVKSG